jgi:hypothetical protein
MLLNLPTGLSRPSGNDLRHFKNGVKSANIDASLPRHSLMADAALVNHPGLGISSWLLLLATLGR